MYFYPIDGTSFLIMLLIVFIALVGYVVYKYLPHILVIALLLGLAFVVMWLLRLIVNAIGVFWTVVLVCVLVILFFRALFKAQEKQLEKERRETEREEQMRADTAAPDETNDAEKNEHRNELPQRIKKVYPSTDEEARNRE